MTFWVCQRHKGWEGEERPDEREGQTSRQMSSPGWGGRGLLRGPK